MVRLTKRGRTRLRYDAEVLHDDGTHLVVRAQWSEPAARDLGFIVFEPGDVFTEHYWRDRWYSVKEIHTESGSRKGWYCDVARPVRVLGDGIASEDLELDLWASADLDTVVRLDEDEFAASGIADVDAEAAAIARRALDEVEVLARAGFPELDAWAPASRVEG